MNPISSLNHVALVVGFPTGLGKAEYCDLWRDRLQEQNPFTSRMIIDATEALPSADRPTGQVPELEPKTPQAEAAPCTGTT